MDETWGSVINAWLSVLVAANRPVTTVNLRRYQLTRVARELAPAGPWDITGDQLVSWAGAKTWSAETRRSWRSALRGFYAWAVHTGRSASNPALELPAVKAAEPNPRPLPEDEYAMSRRLADDRVQLLIRIAGEAGLRRGEACRIHARDVQRMVDGTWLTVHGKGNKTRRVPLDDNLAAAIRLACHPNGYLFPGRIDGHLSPAYVGRLVSRALPDGWGMHTLRHRFATMTSWQQRDLLIVMQLLGHASVATTQRYVLTPGDALRRAVTDLAHAS